MNAPTDDLAGQPVTVMGLGLFGGGSAVARWFAARGARVTVTDLRGADQLAPSLDELAGLDLRFVLGEHRLEDFRGARTVVANPAVPPGSPLLAAARAAGARVTSEMELFLDLCPARLALVTGTQGKSSTCHFLHQLLGAAGVRSHLGGNIGGSLLDRIEELGPEDVAVVEISSYQLEALATPTAERPARVEAIAITNVLADHLERHGSPEAYLACKLRVLELLRPGGWAVLPADDRRVRGDASGATRPVVHRPGPNGGTGLEIDRELFLLDGAPLAATSDLRLRGEFQRANALVALGLARLLGAETRFLAPALRDLSGLPHRLEDLGRVTDPDPRAKRPGPRVIDNGVSTTPDSTVAALEALEETCTLLCGGQAKRGLGLEGLAATARRRGANAVTFGAAGAVLEDAFRGAGVEVVRCDTLSDAVRTALARTPSAETLLFSPACSSFDAYPNFRARALAFRKLLPLGPA